MIIDFRFVQYFLLELKDFILSNSAEANRAKK